MTETIANPNFGSPNNAKMTFIILALFGLYIFFLPDYVDPSFSTWTLYIYHNGLGHIYETGSNYLPVYHYFLWLFGKLEGAPEKITENLKYLRLFSLFFEFCAIYFVLKMVKLNQKKTHNLFYALIILLNAAYFYNTLAFGQTDGMLTTFIFISFYFAINEKLTFSLIFYVISLNCKLQAILFAPLLFLILLPVALKKSWKYIIVGILVSFCTQFMILLPFIKTDQLKNVWQVVTGGTVNLMPFLAPSANSLWRWLIPGNQGINMEVFVDGKTIQMLDTGLFLGISYRHWGLLLFCCFSLLALYPLMKKVATDFIFKRKFLIAKKHIPEILLTAALINLCFYFFNTQMHSRYSHYAFIFIATYSIFNKDYFIYVFFSITEFLSLEHDFRFLKLNI